MKAIRIISGDILNEYLNGGEFTLSEFSLKPKTERFILSMIFSAPEKLTGIGDTKKIVSQTWVLEREREIIGISRFGDIFFEFSSYDNNDTEVKIVIPTSHFIPIIKQLSTLSPAFDWESLIETCGLSKNNEIIKMYEQNKAKRQAEYGFDSLQPREYYDKEFGFKTTIERKLDSKIRKNYDNRSEEAINVYSKIIKINPTNAYAYFKRGLAILDHWRWSKTNYMFDKRSKEVVNSEINYKYTEVVQKANTDFQKAISLHPYLLEEYEKCKRQGKIE